MDRPLRILVVTNLWPEGLSYRGLFVRDQVEAVRRRGHTVEVEVVAQSRGKADYLLAAPRVARRVRGGAYDLVHVHYGLAAPAARLVRGVPRVLSLYGSDVNVPWQRRFTRLGTGGVRARIYPSRRLVDAAGDGAGYVVPNGIDRALFTPADRESARRALGLPPDEPIVLFGAAPANPVKGHDVFTDVLAALRTRGINARELVLAADAQPRADVVRKFAAADLLLVTSRRGTESGPLVVKEAAAMGLPVVSVDVGDVAEVLDGVKPSAVVGFPQPWGSAEARQALVDRLADTAAGILAVPARSDGRERTGWLDTELVTDRLIDVYRTILALDAPWRKLDI